MARQHLSPSALKLLESLTDTCEPNDPITLEELVDHPGFSQESINELVTIGQVATDTDGESYYLKSKANLSRAFEDSMGASEDY